MKTSQYIIYNGVLKKEDEFCLDTNNRAFLYGEAFFETIFGHYDKLPFLKLHHKRILDAIEIFGFEPLNEIEDLHQLKDMIIFLTHKNKVYNSYRVRIIFYRKSGGLYLPQNKEMEYIIQITKLEKDPLKAPLKSISLGVYTDISKNASIISKFKTNSLLSVFSSRFANQNQLDDVLILNSNNNIVETTNSNIFFLLKDKIVTPPLSSGCVEGIARHIIINNIGPELNYKVSEEDVTMDIFNKASEIFTTNAIHFINSVKNFKEKRYLNFQINEINLSFLKFVNENLN